MPSRGSPPSQVRRHDDDEFLKSTVRPLQPSVRRPSSSSCNKTFSTSGCAFSTSSKSTTGTARRHLGERTALVVADVARGRADQPRRRVLLHVLGHVDAHHRALVVEQKPRERAGELGLADAGRPEEQERAERPVRVRQAGARAAPTPRDDAHRLVMADDARVQAVLHLDQLLDLALEQARDRDAGPLADHFGDVLLVDLFLDQAHAARVRASSFLRASSTCFSSAGRRP